MATQANPAPSPAHKPTPAIMAKVKAYNSATAKAEVARDDMYLQFKTDAVKLGIADKKMLTAYAILAGFTDGARISEMCGFVFPANAENRAALDEVTEHNAKQSDPKKRISKKVQLALQRAKEPMTVDEAKSLVAKDQTRAARPPGSGTAPEKELTAKEQEKAVKDALSAAASLAKKYGYDRADFAATVEDWESEFLDKILPETEVN